MYSDQSHWRARLALGVLGAFIWVAAAQAAGPPAPVDFNHQIKPLLSDRCFACHGPDEKSRKAKLRLDTREGAFRRTTTGQPILQPGHPDASEFIRRISSQDPEEMMPPPKSNLSLKPDEIELFRRWVQEGAEWKNHWAFLPVVAPAVPAPASHPDWSRNAIDRFILAQLEAHGLHPAAEASRERLLRRLTLDLTGLPPTLAEMDSFVSDTSPQAYERVVDRLLDCPGYGERLAAEWLDVARYADTYGYQADRYNHLWPWRDWVISAFNRNVRFNEFILWQIAGDLLPGAGREERLATAFNRNHRQTNEGGSVEEEFRAEYNADRVHTTAGAFLGLTLECARCHDHKYDPISTRDYYRLFAFFNSTDESGLYSHFTDAIPTPALLLYASDAQERQHQTLKQKVREQEEALDALTRQPTVEYTNWLNHAEPPASAPFPGLVGYYSFDAIVSNRVSNLALGSAQTNAPARLVDYPQPVPGRVGQALRFTGENSVTIENVAEFSRTSPFSFSLWIKATEEQPEIVVLHHQQAGSDAGYQGYQLVLEDGRASFALVHFWPGNALKVRTRDKLQLGEWLQLGITYDGSSRAAGLKLYLNGQPALTEVVKDQLRKDFANRVPLTLAARFRGRGFKNGCVDELRIFDRCVTGLEMAGLWDPDSWAAALRSPGPASQEYYFARVDPSAQQLRRALQARRAEENQLVNDIQEIMTMGDLPTARKTFVLKRGAYDNPGDAVEPGTPDALLPMDPAWPRNRLGLARWLIDRRNPLTSRVIVNRAWQLMFGRGLVLTAEDFGSQGALPTHPELLDWLAQWFMDSGWDTKALYRLIALSATYRQSSQVSPEGLARDPDNQWLSRGPKTRLSAEMLRDQALATAGLLTRRLGGPSVKPYQPEGLWEEKSAGWKYEPDHGPALYRRSLYTYWKRTSPPPMMTTFDASERNTCVVRRQATSTPLQALVLLNDPQFVEAARCIAERMLQEGGVQPADRLVFAFRLLTGRRPQAEELAVLTRTYREQLGLFQADPADADALLKTGEAKCDPALNKLELAAATAVVNLLLGFDDVVMKR